MITCSGIGVSYPSRGVQALDGVDAGFQPGEVVMLMGPSGSGKTTLLHVLGGLRRPTIGDVVANGIRPYELSDRRRVAWRRAHVSVLLQHPPLLERRTARENAGVAAAVKQLPRGNRTAHLDGVLASVGLAGRVGNRPTELSGGERQRLGLACALVRPADLLLCDEPTGALDSTTGRQVLELLRGAADEHGSTVVIATHDSVALDFADRVVRLRDGRVVTG